MWHCCKITRTKMVYLVLYISHVSKKEKKNASGFTPKAISTINKEMGGGGGGGQPWGSHTFH